MCICSEAVVVEFDDSHHVRVASRDVETARPRLDMDPRGCVRYSGLVVIRSWVLTQLASVRPRVRHGAVWRGTIAVSAEIMIAEIAI